MPILTPNKNEGGYEIRNSGYLRTVRFDKKVMIDIAKSKGVAGYKYHKKTTYVTLDSRENHLVVLESETLVPNKTRLKPSVPSSPYLIDSNGWVDLVKHEANIYSFKLKSNVALEANFYLPKGCKVPSSKEFKIKNRRLAITSTQKGVELVFKCQ